MPIVSLPDLLPQPAAWSSESGAWDGSTFTGKDPVEPFAWLLVSPTFHLTAGTLYTFSFSAQFRGIFDYVFAMQRVAGPDARPDRDDEVHARLYENVIGDRTLSLAYRPAASGVHRLALRAPLSTSPDRLRQGAVNRIKIRNARIVAQTIGAGRISKAPIAEFKRQAGNGSEDTCLPHWTRLQRAIHRRCRRSKRFNNLVAAIEMRLGRDELLSLPQYMALCPTGQCNALCDFCSVTVNRTGILKKQLPFDRLTDFLGPVAQTARVFGMEGNGEPTLYAYFPELLDSLTRHSGKAYLITNGSRLNATNIPFLLCLDSINFSLNAATAESHQRVMKLKNFEEIIASIRSLVVQRGRLGEDHVATPLVSVSFVVTADNVHEIQDFLHLAEQVLGVDVIWIRPLSELGNDLGTVEDFRSIVPFEADLRDMFDAVAEYKSDHPRRSEIRIDPGSYRSFKPNPVGRVVAPRGFAGRLLAPRRDQWDFLQGVAEASWHLHTLRVSLPALAGPFLECEPIAVEPNATLELAVSAQAMGGKVSLLVQDLDRNVLARLELSDEGHRPRRYSAQVQTGPATALILTFVGHGAACRMEVDFERLRTSAPLVSGEFRLPDPHRWESCVPELQLKWNGPDCVSIRSETGGGPYLLKSYGIACRQDTTVMPGVEVDVRAGALTIGILSESGTDWLTTKSFGAGKSAAPLGFFTATNDRIHAVVASDPGTPVEATIRWVAQHPAPVVALDQQTHSPDRWKWRASVPDVDAAWRDGRITVKREGEGAPYLAQTGPISCRSGRRLSIPATLTVKRGRLGFGILNAAGDAWLHTESFEPGEHRCLATCTVAGNASVSAVVFALEGEPADAEVELAAPEDDGALGAVEEDETQTDAPLQEREEPSAQFPVIRKAGGGLDVDHHDVEPALAAAAMPGPGAWRTLWRLIKGDVHFYCQKPWTDLHNFSVDGRMDVCCIATGASQERYQLGNLNKHTFQEIWNGASARAFRRTVNSGEPLPPCARCPMLHAYQGTWFDPIYTDGLIREPLRRRVKRLTGSRNLAKAATTVAGFVLSKVVFRGFSQARRWN